MKTYIALLRGINVSGQKIIKMAELRASLEKAGFSEVKTYIQSGNIIFESDNNDVEALEAQVKAVILKDFGFDVPVMIKTADYLKDSVANNPFSDDETTRLFLVFLDQEPAKERLEKVAELDYSPEKYVVDGKRIYFFSPLGMGKAKMSNNFFEAKLKVTATGRNWRTVHKLIEMAEG